MGGEIDIGADELAGPVCGAANSAPASSTSSAPSSLRATPTCRGKRATIVAVAGRPSKGTRKRDVIVGTPRRDVIEARGGNDLVCGRGGRDLIRGGPGRDTLVGGRGRDRLIGGRGRDRLIGKGDERRQ